MHRIRLEFPCCYHGYEIFPRNENFLLLPISHAIFVDPVYGKQKFEDLVAKERKRKFLLPK